MQPRFGIGSVDVGASADLSASELRQVLATDCPRMRDSGLHNVCEVISLGWHLARTRAGRARRVFSGEHSSAIWPSGRNSSRRGPSQPVFALIAEWPPRCPH